MITITQLSQVEYFFLVLSCDFSINLCNFASGMMTEYNDSSESGFLTGAFEDVSQVFTDVEVIATSEVNVVAKAKRYGRWWLLKGLRAEVAAAADYRQRQEAKKAEMLRREQSQQRMSVAFMAGVDSLRKSVSESGIGAQERYDRGVHTIEQHVENRAYGLTDEEKKEVRVCLLSVLETMKKGWQD